MRSVRRLLLPALVLVLVAAAMAYVERDRLASFNLWRHSGVTPVTAMPSDAGTSPGSPNPPRNETRGAVDLDARRRQLIGVRTAEVTRQTRTPHMRAVGTIKVDEARVIDVNVRVEGWVRDLVVNVTGQQVSAGQVLFSLYSPDVVATVDEYLLAIRGRAGARQSVVPGAAQQMDDLASAAKRRLTLWGIPSAYITALEMGRRDETVAFSSPMNGIVLEKSAVEGMRVMPGQTLYRIADLSSVWMDADVRESDLPLVRIGADVTVTLDASGGAPIQGRAIYISPTLQDETRTAKVRVELANAGGRLRPGMFATMDLDAPSVTSLVVPTDAVLDSGSEQIVFVDEGEGHFTPRHVKAGARFDDVVAIVSGLKAGERVATGAAFFLDSESQVRGAAAAYGASASGADTTPQPGPGAIAKLAITMRSTPAQLRAGENDLEVTVRDAQGAAVTDADVSVQFYMAAMPSMNMPAMRGNTKLVASGDGRYRGTTDVQMIGRWDVTITVARAGRVIGTSVLSLTAR